MEKKRFKMYKKGKNWVVSSIVFLGAMSIGCFLTNNNQVYAYESDNPQVQKISEEVTENKNSSTQESPVNEVAETEPESSMSLKEDEAKQEKQIEPTYHVENVTKIEETSTSDLESPSVTKDKNVDNSPKIDDINETESSKAILEDDKPDTNSSTESASDINKGSSNMESTNTVEKQSTTFSTSTDTTQSSPANRAAVAKASRIPIYRVYNPNSGEHLHTKNAGERDYLVKVGWRNEGISMYVDGTGYDLYRLYNPNSGEHFYTLTAKERDNLKKHGWRYEGIAWKTPKTGQPMYRVFNPNATGAGSHHYTSLLSERNHLVKVGWRNEGIAWYTVGGSQSVASYVLLNSPYINQNSSGYPMGCEAASLLQALQTKGRAKNYNLKSFIKEMPLSSNNNPNNGFSGKPDRVTPGVYQSIYAKPLAQWGSKYGKVADISGSSVETLKDELRKGNPVVVYVTGNYAKPVYGKYWWGTGIDNAHIVTLDGFNESNNTYHISDPNAGKYWVSASKFEASYNLRKSAVVVR